MRKLKKNPSGEGFNKDKIDFWPLIDTINQDLEESFNKNTGKMLSFQTPLVVNVLGLACLNALWICPQAS